MLNSRKKEVKKGIDAEEARRKREENIIELRKSKRDENLLKKRQTFATPQYALEDSTKHTAGSQRVRGRLGSPDSCSAGCSPCREIARSRPTWQNASSLCLAPARAAGRAAHDGERRLLLQRPGAVRGHAEVQEALVHR